MTGWSHGYNITAGYTFGFYRETAPDWIDFGLMSRGFETPRSSPETPFRYLELGCGQGFGLCLLAAANPQGWFLGIDFSPEHIAHAQALADQLGLTNIRFVEGDFLALQTCWPADYGSFDYVTLHGIYSWVPQQIRRSLVAILGTATAPGAAIYISYNSMPGWASTLPIQHMLRLLETEGVGRGMAAIEAGRDLFERMESAGSWMTRALPALKQRIDGLRNQPPAYLVQEYLHDNWHPLWCSQVMSELADAKLDLVASATMAENLLPTILPPALQEVLRGREERKVREDLIDCLINQTFRRDLFVRGARRRHPGDAKWREDYRVMRTNPATVPDELTVMTGFGGVTLKADILSPLFEALEEDGRSIAELADLPAFRAEPHLLMQRVMLLLQNGWLGCFRGGAQPAPSAAAANLQVAASVGQGAPYRHLAADRLRSGVPATDSEMLMLLLHAGDPAGFEEKGSKLLRERLERLGRQLAKDGKPLPPAEQATEADRQVAQFSSQTLPLWRRLGVVS